MNTNLENSTVMSDLGADFMASVVVFLVALPLCMGVAIASGAPPALGLVTGIVGGIVVGAFAGQPFQVSGPAAGLAVMVWQIIENFGLRALGMAVLICGIVQAVAGLAKLGRWFRAVSPALIQGMLAGIGVIILGSQFHVMIDDAPKSSTLHNLATIPASILKAFSDGGAHFTALMIGLGTIATIFLWDKFKPKKLSIIPGTLLGVLLASAISIIFTLDVRYITLPENFWGEMNWIGDDVLHVLSLPTFWAQTLGLAVIASAETLLCATAVDRIHDGVRTQYDKELFSQGVGNIVCGVFGALPVCGVIVRSSANVEAGARTRKAAMMHGLWILLVIAFFPSLLSYVPTSCLAGVLVLIGIKLINFPQARQLLDKGRDVFAIWGITVTAIVCTNLLVGVCIGFGVALLRLLRTFAQVTVDVKESEVSEHLSYREGSKKLKARYDVHIHGAATFISLPKIAEALEAIPDDSEVHVHLDDIAYLDHACIELIEEWHARHPGEVILETDRLLEMQSPTFTKAGAQSRSEALN